MMLAALPEVPGAADLTGHWLELGQGVLTADCALSEVKLPPAARADEEEKADTAALEVPGLTDSAAGLTAQLRLQELV